MSCACQHSCYAVLSFLHVPGRMSAPLWLMMGTAFRIAHTPHEKKDDDNDDIHTGTRANTSTTTTSPSSTVTALFLTAKHTFLPWDGVRASVAAEMKIPDEYRKARYVVGKLYRCDAVTHASIAATPLPLQLAAVHPTLDVALLVLRHEQHKNSNNSNNTTTTTTTNNNNNSEATRAAIATVLSAPPLPMWTRHDATAAPRGGCLVGCRGNGALGELDTLDASLLRTLPGHARDALLREMATVEGKQTRVAVDVRLTDATRGVCRVVRTGAKCYHGMSGAPLLVKMDNNDNTTASATTTTTKRDDIACCAYAGVLYGMHADERECLGITPAAHFADWLRDAVTRVCST